MNENAKAWVAALRSGEYEQCQGVLRHDDSYCCLGVACDLYAEATGGGHWSGDSFCVPRDDGSAESLDCDGTLPDRVTTWLGLQECDGSYDDLGACCLADDNDDGASFEEIADTIEAEPQGLFA